MGAECCRAIQKATVSTLRFDAMPTQEDDNLSEIQQLLERYQKIYQSFSGCQLRIEGITGHPLDSISSFIKNMQVFLWSLSAFFSGEISQSELVIKRSSPFLTLGPFPVPNEVQNMMDCLCVYLNIIASQSHTLKQASTELHSLNDRMDQEQRMQNAKSDKSTTSPKSRGNSPHNYQNAVKELKQIEKTMVYLLEANAKLPWLMDKIDALYDQADDVGSQAHFKRISTPKAIGSRFAHFLEQEENKPLLFRTSTRNEDGYTTFRSRRSISNRTSLRKSFLRESTIRGHFNNDTASSRKTVSVMAVPRSNSQAVDIKRRPILKKGNTDKTEEDETSNRHFVIVNKIKGVRNTQRERYVSINDQRTDSIGYSCDYKLGGPKRSKLPTENNETTSVSYCSLTTARKFRLGPNEPNDRLFTLNGFWDANYSENISDDDEEAMNCSIQDIKESCFRRRETQQYYKLNKRVFN